MKLTEILSSESDTKVEEGVKRAFKKSGDQIKRYFRCTSGLKKGMLVADPATCGTRKDPKKVRTAKKTMRSKKTLIAKKTKISKNKSISKLIKKLNSNL